MANQTADPIDQEVRAAFPPGTIQQVQVQEYGDDPEIEPGQVAVRIFIDHEPRPGDEAGYETLRRFVQANREAVRKLRREQPSIGWIEFRLGGEELTEHGAPAIRTAPGREPPPGESAAELTSVMTRLGPEDLATVDTLITAGIANSRAEVLRWALGRIREHSAYAQIQERVREISELKAQF
jgi:hypothetical protein